MTSTASAFITLAAPADRVWQLVGAFDALPAWLPAVVKSTLEEGGRVRRLMTADDAVVVERLLTFDEGARRYSYAIVSGPLPVRDYLATLQVTAAPGGDSCSVVWASQFEATGADPAATVAMLGQGYQAGLDALRTKLGL